MKLFMERVNSDKAASNTVETIILIVLAVFAALALFTGILNPVRQNADNLGEGLTGWFTKLMSSANKEGGQGQNIEFNFGGRAQNP